MVIGLGSLDELLFMYLFAGFIALLVWAWLEAEVVLGDVEHWPEREVARLRRTRVLAVLGVVHVAFAVVALSAARAHGREEPPAGPTRTQRRAMVEAAAALLAG